MNTPKNRHLYQLSSLVIADMVVFGTINTKTAPSYMLIVGFLLLAATISYMIKGVIALVGMYGVPLKHKKRLQIASSAVVIGIIALQSMGQLSVQEVFIFAVVSLLIYLYFAYAKARQPKLAT